jgi:hypothetical protein
VSELSVTAVVILFAYSRNICFFPGCDERLTDTKWKMVNAEVAHIKGENPGSARGDSQQLRTDSQGYDNLMLLCVLCRVPPRSIGLQREGWIIEGSRLGRCCPAQRAT